MAMPSWQERTHRCGRFCLTAGGLLALGSAFAALLPWSSGLWSDSEPVIMALHLASMLAALGLALDFAARPEPVRQALSHPLVLLALAAALWSLVGAALSPLPLLALLGPPQTGEGALLFLELGVWIAAALRLRADPRSKALLGAAGLAVAVLVPPMALWPETRIYFFHDWLVFYAIAAPVVAVTWLDDVLAGPRLAALAFAAALPGLAVSANMTGLAAAAGIGLPAFLLLSRLAPPRRRPAAAVLAAAAAILPAAIFALVWLLGPASGVASLRSRALIDRVMVQPLLQDPSLWLTGQGWGQGARTFLLHLNASGEAVWQQRWDATWRDFVHSHHGGLEALLAGGLPGLALALALPAMLVWLAPGRLLPLAGAFALVLAAVLSLWFQLPPTMPVVALAAAGLTAEPRRPPRAWLRRAVPLLLPVGALAPAAAFAFLALQGAAMRQDLAPETLGRQACARLPDEAWRGYMGLSRVFYDRFTAAMTGSTVPSSDLSALACAAEAAAAEGAAHPLAAVLQFRAEVSLLPPGAPLRSEFEPLLASWEERLHAWLRLAPGRGDLAVAYFGWLLAEGRPKDVAAAAERMLADRPEDPVALWFSGSVLLAEAGAGTAEGLGRLRRALRNGVGQFIPVDAALQQRLLEMRIAVTPPS